MTDQTRSDQSAEIAHRADERAQAAQRSADRVERALTDRIEDISEAMAEGFEKVFHKLDSMTDEIVALKMENAKRSGIERFLKWAVTILLTAIGIFFGVHHVSPNSR
jgi:soluble cytochrome b562